MDKLGVHQKRSKQAKAKKQCMKVVYISNPMHFEASAGQFRALVQKLTGQDSDIADLSDSTMLEAVGDPPAPQRPGLGSGSGAGLKRADNGSVGAHHEPYKGAVSEYDMSDDGFPPALLENFQEFMPASMFYEPPTHVGAMQSIDEV